MVLPSGARNASSAAKPWPRGRLPVVGKRHSGAPVDDTTRSRPFPRSAMSRPPGNRPPPVAGAVSGGANVRPATPPDAGTWRTAAGAGGAAITAVVEVVGAAIAAVDRVGDAALADGPQAPTSNAMATAVPARRTSGRSRAIGRCMPAP